MREDLKRKVLVEAGHRCAIPTCGHPTTEIAHIVPYAKVKEHKFENLIALCPNCHTRYDNKEIDRKSMVQYKASLTIVNGRYGDLERRILDLFAQNPEDNVIQLPGSLEILIYYLLKDGMLQRMSVRSGISVSGSGGEVELTPRSYKLTDKGRNFVDRWISAQEVQ